MLARTLRWSLERPRLIALACLGFLVWGALTLRDLPVELAPEAAPAETTIHTEAPGLGAEQVETLVTRPIEAAILGAAGVGQVRSASVQGLSTITIAFAPHVDPARVRAAVSERLTGLGDVFPGGVSAPRMAPLTSVGGRILRIGFTSDRLDPMSLRDEVDWVVRPRLLAAAGVGRASVYGGAVRRLEVRARPGDLSDSDLGFLDILRAVRRATSVAGAGFIDTDAQRVLIEPRGQTLTKEDVGAGQIQTPGSAPVRIEDVSDVSEAPAPAFGDALIGGKPGIIVDLVKQYGANTIDATHAAEAALALLGPELAAKGVRVSTDLDNPAHTDAQVVGGIALDVAIGAVLIAAVLALVVRDLRATAVSLAAIPLSLVAALAVFRIFGWTLNAMTIGGLAVGLGVVIDDAVIDVENILGRLRSAPEERASRLEGVLAASLEVRAPVLYATVAMIVALTPVLALQGTAGALLAPLAGAAIVTCTASLAVSILVTPALALVFLQHVTPQPPQRLVHRVREAHADLLSRVGRRPWPLVVLAFSLAGAAVIALLTTRPGPVPAPEVGPLRIAVSEPAGASLAVSRAYGERAAAVLAPITGVSAVSERIGRDAEGDDSAGPERGIIELSLTPGQSDAGRARVALEAARRLRVLPGLNPLIGDLSFPGASGAGAPVEVRVFGENLDRLDDAAGQVARALRSVAGARGVRVEPSAVTPVVRVDINFQRLALYGLSSSDVLETLQAAFAGETVGKIYVGDRVVDLAVSAQQSLRQDPEGVGDLLLRSTSGISVPLKAVANVYLTDDRALISHEGGFRRRLVTAQSTDPSRTLADARSALARLQLPPGVFLQIDSAYLGERATRDRLAANYLFALLAVFALLSIEFDGRTAAIILASSLFSLLGAAVAVVATGGVLSPGAAFGMIALFGLSLRGSILVFARLEEIVLSGEAPWSIGTVARAARERLAPILTTALLIALALAPLALHAGEAGREVLGPMAIVILCGLATGTLGALLILPLLITALWNPGFARRARAHGAPRAAPSA